MNESAEMEKGKQGRMLLNRPKEETEVGQTVAKSAERERREQE